MPHCNGKTCVQSSTYDGDERTCACTCDPCTSTSQTTSSSSREPVTTSASPSNVEPRRRRPTPLSTRTGVTVAAVMVGAYLVFSHDWRKLAPIAPEAHAQASATSEGPGPTEKPTPATAPAPPPHASSLAEAIALNLHAMTDTTDEVSDGAINVAVWMQQNAVMWSALAKVPDTTIKRVLKDSESERGKRICVDGSLVEIHVANLTSTAKAALGGIMDGNGEVLRFIALRSTGDLVGGSWARFCGVTTGRYSYTTTKQTTMHAVFAVGLFDLPANRAEPKPAPAPTAVEPLPPGSPMKPAKAKPKCLPCEDGQCPNPRSAPDCEW